MLLTFDTFQYVYLNQSSILATDIFAYLIFFTRSGPLTFIFIDCVIHFCKIFIFIIDDPSFLTTFITVNNKCRDCCKYTKMLPRVKMTLVRCSHPLNSHTDLGYVIALKRAVFEVFLKNHFQLTAIVTIASG